MKKIRNSILMLLLLLSLTVCNFDNKDQINIRESIFMKDGFTPEKFDLVLDRIFDEQTELISKTDEISIKNEILNPRLMISPHDDAAFVGYLYPSLFKTLAVKTVFIIGVAHKARNFNLEDNLIFDSYDQWETAKGVVDVSNLRNELLNLLPENTYVVHDGMQLIEHSVESIVPYMQYYKPDVEIVSILVPYMNFERMKYLANYLSDAIIDVTDARNMIWGKDYSIVISTDAVHYGDEDWGGSNFDRFGVDSAGYFEALNFENEIIKNCLSGEITEQKVQRFINYTVKKEDYKSYKWTWCGRYCIPFGMLTAKYMDQKSTNLSILKGIPLGYSTSISNPRVKIDDIVKYDCAQSDLHHWVGYPAVVFQ